MVAHNLFTQNTVQMSVENTIVAAHYGGRVRLRVCGLLRRSDGALLCGLHKGVGPLGQLWVPPGGGVELGEPLATCLEREFLEETGLQIRMGVLFKVYEYIGLPLHAVEIFYYITQPNPGQPVLGTDPEWPKNLPPVLTELAWITAQKAKNEPAEAFHAVVHDVFAQDPPQ